MTIDQHVLREFPTRRGCPFDPPAELATIAESQEIVSMAYPDGHTGWLVTSYPLARTILASAAFSTRHELRHSPVPTMLKPTPAPPGAFIGMDPPEHTRYRKPLSQYFTVRRIRQLEPAIERVTTEYLDAMERLGPPADLMQAFALPIPVQVISDILGSGPEFADELQRLRAVTLDPQRPADDVAASVRATHELMGRLVSVKRREPADDLLSRLIADGDLNDQELTGLALMMLIAGHETTAHTIGLSTYFLLQDEDLRRRLTAGPALSDAAVGELLRYLTNVQFVTRTALTDVELGGVLIKKGECCTISLSAANRDARYFPDPNVFAEAGARGSHLAFGHGIHQCIGQNLARAEIRIAISALLRRFPRLRLAADHSHTNTRDAMNTYGLDRLPVVW
ncbi:cytochrome P450 [Micromonospora eburnea]|uniref:Cytochrome P450 n=1 Tax=Micromonospora eburnea TaxID=227316 RepID=A0A1C6V1T9_9ACTN|nr:cytochrome P450 [Micromonospora eburnea]SCL59920.1 Cytochrome P450 [Micromonospora eburnea]